MKNRVNMSNLLQKYIDKIIGAPDRFSLNQRLIAMICVILILASVGFVIPTMISYTSIIGSILIILIFVSASVYYYLIRIKNKSEKYIWLLILFTQILVSVIFFYTSGSRGTNNYGFLIIIVFILLLPGRNLFFALILFNIISLMVIEYFYPELILNYTDSRARFYDHLLAIVVTAFIFYLTINLFRKAYVSEREKNLAQNKELEMQKEQILLLSERERRINEMKMNFFANISHEFRTPLALIKSPAEKLLADDTDKRRREHYNIILENMQKLNQLVDQVLDFRKIDIGKAIPEPKELDITIFVRDILKSFASLAETKQIKMTLVQNTGPLIMAFDPVKTEKVLNNIITNALKFSPPESKIEIITQKINGTETDVFRISVADNGKGIPWEHQKDIFTPYFQLPGTEYGTGLGLAIAKEYVESMKGEVRLESTPGKGCRFFIDLPIVGGKDMVDKEVFETKRQDTAIDSYDHRTEQKNGEVVVDTDTDKHTLLIVEDNNDIIAYLKDAFSDGYFVMSCNNGIEALEKISETVPDLIISDVMMPGMDGIELCRRIKSEQVTCHVPVILLTAKAGEENTVEGILQGADDYITKPFSMDELKARARNIIVQREILRQRFSSELDTIAPENLAQNIMDRNFLKEAIEIVERNMTDQEFGPTELVIKLDMSRSMVFLKLKKLAGVSPSRFIALVRLRMAAKLLNDMKLNVSEVAYRVGFNDHNYFTRLFKKTFHKTPSEYRKRK